MLAMVLALILAAPDQDTDAAAAALAIARARAVEVSPSTAPPIPGAAWLDYKAGCAQAMLQNKPLVVFVGGYGYGGRNVRPIPGAVTALADRLEGYASGDIVVSVPRSGWLEWYATLPTDATDAQIIASWQNTEPVRRAVAPVAVPFLSAQPKAADDNQVSPVWRRRLFR